MKLSIFTDKRRVNKDGTYNIYIRCAEDGKKFLIHTGMSCLKEPDKYTFSSDEPNGNAKSARLMSLYSKCEEFLYHNQGASMESVKESLTVIVTGKEKKKKNLLRDAFARYTSGKYDGTRKLYDRTFALAVQFDEKADFSRIDRFWLERFESFLRQRGIKTNTISIHMRNLRAIFNFAIEEEITDKYPFRKYKIKHEQTRKRDMTADQLRTIASYPLTEKSAEYRDMFMLMFYLCGINASDLFELKRSNLRNGRIEYYRHKTKKYYSIKVEPEAKAIIDKYKGEDWLLSPMDTNADYHFYLKRMNQQLKKIGMTYTEGKGWSGDALFPDITTYYARHTWASIAAEIDIPMDVIAQALGHSTPYSTTDIYVNRRLKKIDEANRKVIDFINNV